MKLQNPPRVHSLHNRGDHTIRNSLLGASAQKITEVSTHYVSSIFFTALVTYSYIYFLKT